MLPLSFLYGMAVTVRNWLFETGSIRRTRVAAPVISVGNISAGGTGKTPFVDLIVRKLRSRGRKPAVVSRGYGRKSSGYVVVSEGLGVVADARSAGDEPVQLAERRKDVIVVVDENRVEGAQRALGETTADVIVLDDGFQHRYLERDIDIVLVTAKELLSRQWLLPAGNRREKTSSLGRSDAIVISKCGDVMEYEKARNRLLTRHPDVIAGCRLVPTSLTNAAGGENLDRENASRSPALVFAGLGDPASFVKSAQEFGCMVARSVFFRDHHWYTVGDLARLRVETDQYDLRLMVTTRKDLARIRSLGIAGEEFLERGNVYILDVDTVFIDGEDAIDRLINEAVK